MCETSQQFKQSQKKKSVCVMWQRTALASICHHTLKCQREAIMWIRKMQALRNETPEQNSQDRFHGVFLAHVSARRASPSSSAESKLGIAATGGGATLRD